MNDNSTGPFIIGMLFILRCLIPLGILFGISYLLQRLGLVDNHVEEKKTGLAEETERDALVSPESSRKRSPSKSGIRQKQGKTRAAASKSRSRNP